MVFINERGYSPAKSRTAHSYDLIELTIKYTRDTLIQLLSSNGTTKQLLPIKHAICTFHFELRSESFGKHRYRIDSSVHWGKRREDESVHLTWTFNTKRTKFRANFLGLLARIENLH